MINTKFVQKNIHGWGCLSALNETVRSFNAKTAVIITDPFLKQNGTADKIGQQLAAEGIRYEINDNVVAEPPLAVGQALVDFLRDHQADIVIGLGGGSAMDLAKLAAVLATQEGDVKDYLNLTGTRKIAHRGLPKIMIPTTSGTGSEVTNISVLSLENTKDVIVDDALLADVAIVDPELTVSVPAHITAATGIDALTHAVEAYVSINATPITDALALQAIKLISHSIETAVKNGNDQQARSDMSFGSYLAGIAFFNAGVAGVHALAYPLGGQFHIAHGDSNAVLLPYVMGYIRSHCQTRLKNIYTIMGYHTHQLSEEEASIQCIHALTEIVKNVGIPNTLQAFGIQSIHLDSLTHDACQQTRLLARSPRELKKADIANIYQAAYEGKYFQ